MITKEVINEKLEEKKKKINELINQRGMLANMIEKAENEILRLEGMISLLNELVGRDEKEINQEEAL